MPSSTSAEPASLSTILTKVNRILEIEEKQEKRRKWGILFQILWTLFYFALPVGVGYAMILYLSLIHI